MTARILARVLDPETGVLGRLTSLLVTASGFARDQAGRDLLPAEVGLALGNAANVLDDLCLDLEGHADTLAALRLPSAPAVSRPVAARPAAAAGRGR